ncbi:MAG: type IV secretory system conjugative DNA transfer family protein [Fimbriimonas sp.]
MSGFPPHWIGVRSGWEEMTSWGDALVHLPIHHLKTHALVIGATGSGETTLLHHLMVQDIVAGHSLVILDLHGDQVAVALELCAGNVDPAKIALFDLREKRNPQGFNPLFGAGDPYFRALGVLDVVAAESDSWGVQLAETLRNGVMLLAEADSSLPAIERLFYDAEFRLSLIQKCSSENVSAFWKRYGQLSPDKQSSMATPVLNKVSLLLATDSLRKTLGHPAPLDLGKHINTPGSVTLVSLASDELHSAGRMMGSLMLSSICREIFSRVHVPESKRVPVRLYVDEFEHFGLKEFENILAEGRRFGLSLCLAHQTLAQLSPRMRSMILNNVGVKLVFRTGREDSAVLSKDLTGDPKLLDISGLPVGEAILAVRGYEPFQVEINAPMFSDVGVRSPAAKDLIRLLQARNAAAVEREVSPTANLKPPVEPKSDKPRSAGSKVQLEDWL